MIRSIDQVTDRAELRKVLVAELGRSLATSMAETYAAIVTDLRAAGLKPVSMSVRHAQRDSGFMRTGSRFGLRHHEPAGRPGRQPRAGAGHGLRPWRLALLALAAAERRTQHWPGALSAPAPGQGSLRVRRCACADAGHPAGPGRCRADDADPPPGLHRHGAGRRGFRLRRRCRRCLTRSTAISRPKPAAPSGGAEPDPRPPRRTAPGHATARSITW